MDLYHDIIDIRQPARCATHAAQQGFESRCVPLFSCHSFNYVTSTHLVTKGTLWAVDDNNINDKRSLINTIIFTTLCMSSIYKLPGSLSLLSLANPELLNRPPLMKEPRTPATLRVPSRRQHPRLLLERDVSMIDVSALHLIEHYLHQDIHIMRQTFSAEHQLFKARRQAPAVARSGAQSLTCRSKLVLIVSKFRYSSYASLNLLDFVSKKIQRAPTMYGCRHNLS